MYDLPKCSVSYVYKVSVLFTLRCDLCLTVPDDGSVLVPTTVIECCFFQSIEI